MPFHCVCDTETLDTRRTCAVISIGAVTFDPVAGKMGEEFYIAVDLKSCTDLGMTVSVPTLLWWMKQSDAARKAAFAGGNTINAALHALAGFYRYNASARKFWSHGAGFDAVLLEDAYVRTKIEVPWTYKDVRDTRTIFELAGIDLRDFMPKGDIVHHALDDARAEAKAIMAAYEKLGMRREAAAPQAAIISVPTAQIPVPADQF